MIIFVIDDPAYILNYLNSYLFNFNGLIFIVLLTLIYFFIERNRKKLKLNKKKVILLALLPIFILALLNNVRHADSRIMLPLDTAFFLGLKRSVEPIKKSTLYANFNRNQPSIIEKSKYDIVLIINESWSKDGLRIYNKPSKATPFLDSWIEFEKNNFLIFRDFYSNSGATDLMFQYCYRSGQFESNDKLHKVPFYGIGRNLRA